MIGRSVIAAIAAAKVLIVLYVLGASTLVTVASAAAIAFYITVVGSRIG